MSHYIFFKIITTSWRMKMENIVRYMRWGIRSSGGVRRGMPKSVGKRIAAVGRVKISFDW